MHICIYYTFFTNRLKIISPQTNRKGLFLYKRLYKMNKYILEKFLVASMVVSIAPCVKTEEI